MSKFKTSTDKRASVSSRLTQMFKESPDRPEIHQEILMMAGELVPSSSQSLFLRDNESGSLQEVASVGEKVDLIDFVPFELGTGLSAWVAKERRPIRIAGIGKRSREVGSSFMAVPLLADDALVGVMTFAAEDPRIFSDEDILVAESLAAQIAAALERRLFRQQTDRLHRRISKLSEDLVVTRQELKRTRSDLDRKEQAVLLVERIDAPLAELTHVVDYLEQEYGNKDVRLCERLSVISDECSRIATIVRRIAQISGRTLSNTIAASSVDGHPS